MKRIIVTKIDSCYSCPNYERDTRMKIDRCYIIGFITIKADKDGYYIAKDCPLREDK